jgi:hypothetical protein
MMVTLLDEAKATVLAGLGLFRHDVQSNVLQRVTKSTTTTIAHGNIFI